MSIVPRALQPTFIQTMIQSFAQWPCQIRCSEELRGPRLTTHGRRNAARYRAVSAFMLLHWPYVPGFHTLNFSYNLRHIGSSESRARSLLLQPAAEPAIGPGPPCERPGAAGGRHPPGRALEQARDFCRTTRVWGRAWNPSHRRGQCWHGCGPRVASLLTGTTGW